ncbi:MULTISPECIES: hypothetical protein [Pseudoalteromonas]|nr:MULTISPECIES: hypothetical protein [Pseudoalteromonas]MCF2917932.1 hypothetical protein [Pseudoalteromonas sp. Cn5-37]MCH2088649.1 hypothetical protein [Pseudoalteromonas sp.]MED5511560.1 hypothetical protein [Pseudomonadota bacterium]
MQAGDEKLKRQRIGWRLSVGFSWLLATSQIGVHHLPFGRWRFLSLACH